MTEPCKMCGGTGKILVDEYTIRMCICAYAKMLRKHIGDDIALVKAPKSSPLFVPNGVDRTTENLILQGSWRDVAPHLKWVLSYKGLKFRSRVTDDKEILDVWLNKRCMAQLDKSNPFNYPVIATMLELMGPHNDLVIIRFGSLMHPNKAMANVLIEALRQREFKNKPTWLIEEPYMPFGEGHTAWNSNVAAYLEAWFQEVDLQDQDSDEPEEEVDSSPIADVSLEEPVKPIYRAPAKVPRERPVVLSEFTDDDLDLGNAGGGNKKKKHW